MSAKDIPQSVVEAMRDAFVRAREPLGGAVNPVAEPLSETLTAALREYERLGYRLVRADEATVERAAEAVYQADGWQWQDWPPLPDAEAERYRRMARAALTAARGGEETA